MTNILILTDGKNGHESISKGFVSYLSTKEQTKIYMVKTKLKIAFFRSILKFILNHFFISQKNSFFIQKIFYKNYKIPKNIDLIISAGGETSFANAILAKEIKCKNIFIGSLRGLNPNLFTNIILLQSQGFKNEIIVDLAPIHVHVNKAQIKEFILKNKIDTSEKIWSILIGGNTKEYYFKTSEIKNMLLHIVEKAKLHNAKLMITTSRRSSQEFEKEVNNIAQNYKDIFIKVILYNQIPQKAMQSFLSLSETIFCTEDSGSMITEAILSKKRVYTIYPKKRSLQNIYRVFIDQNIKNKYIISTDIEAIKNITFNERINRLEKLPAQIIYEKIEKYFKKEIK